MNAEMNAAFARLVVEAAADVRRSVFPSDRAAWTVQERRLSDALDAYADAVLRPPTPEGGAGE